MTPIVSQIARNTAAFQKNREYHLRGVAELHEHLRRAVAGGGEKAQRRHLERGKLLPRQRIDLLLDRDSPFLELCALAGLHESGQVPGAGVVGGIGTVEGVTCLLTASESTVLGGAVGPHGVRKSARLAEIALENRLPVIHCIESAGADLPHQAEIFVPGGGAFRDITERSRLKIPTISLVFGPCTAGGAYVPGMSDYVVMVDQKASMYLAGPPLVRMATGEIVDEETLGGAALHSRKSGVSDYLARDEHDAIRIGREIIASLRPGKADIRPAPVEPPRYPIDDLLGLLPEDPRAAYDVREVIARITDGSRFHEFKPEYGDTLVTGYATIGGYRVGILANQGVLFSEAANKGAQFIALCNQSDTPLLFLQNITGFMVGADAESSGIIKHGAKLINAVTNSTVPAITWMIGGSYGAGNYAMAGRAYRPRFLFTWPNHRIAVMGPEQLAGVLDSVKRESAAKRGENVNEAELDQLKRMLVGKVEFESTCWSATGRLWDDGVVDPRDTRTVLRLVLDALYAQPITGTTSWGTFRH